MIEIAWYAGTALALAAVARSFSAPIAAAICVALLVALWHVLRTRAARRRQWLSRSKLDRIRRLKSEVALLGADPIPKRHPALLEQINLFEKAVTHTLALIARGVIGPGELDYVDLLVHRAAPAALAPLRHTEHKAAIDRARTEFQQLSLRLAAAYLEPNAL